MQLFTLTIAALSIGTQVLAAPAHIKRTVSCIDNGDLTCITKNSVPVVGEILDPVLTTVEETAEPVLSTLPSVPVVDSLVSRQLETLPSDVLTTVNPLTAPAVDIAGGVAGTVESVTSMATDLAGRQLDSLTAPITAPLSPVVESTVGTVASTLGSVAGNVAAAVGPIADTVEETLESVPVVGEIADSVLRRSIPSIVDTEFTGSTIASVEATVDSALAVDSVPVVDSVLPAVLSKLNNGAGSLVASHVSPIIKRSTVSTVSSVVSALVSTITLELDVISTTVDSLSAVSVPGLTDTPILTLSVAPSVAKALTIISSTLNATVVKVLPVLNTVFEPLLDAEIAALGAVLGDVKDLLANIETVILSLLKTVTDEVKPLVVSEVQAVLGAIAPLVAPITSFAFTIVGEVSSTTSQITEVRAVAGEVFATASGLVSPVGSVMAAL